MSPNQLSSVPDAQLLDVRLEDDYEAGHIAGARNNCVFEVAFASRLPACAPDKDAVTVVYGADGESGEAAAALEKLTRLGYRDARILEGGLRAAAAAGVEIVAGRALPAPLPLPEGKVAIDLEESRIEWLGRNLINRHTGTAALQSGHLEFTGGQMTGGEFVIDLTRLQCTDLAGSPLHDVLIAHLHNEDFFDVERHPSARFVIRQVRPAPEETTPGSRNLHIRGDLTLRGQTHPVEFAAAAGLTEQGKPAAQAAFSIDRTRWGVLYGSGRFFRRLAGHLVNDHLEFQIRIIAR